MQKSTGQTAQTQQQRAALDTRIAQLQNTRKEVVAELDSKLAGRTYVEGELEAAKHKRRRLNTNDDKVNAFSADSSVVGCSSPALASPAARKGAVPDSTPGLRAQTSARSAPTGSAAGASRHSSAAGGDAGDAAEQTRGKLPASRDAANCTTTANAGSRSGAGATAAAAASCSVKPAAARSTPALVAMGAAVGTARPAAQAAARVDANAAPDASPQAGPRSSAAAPRPEPPATRASPDRSRPGSVQQAEHKLQVRKVAERLAREIADKGSAVRPLTLNPKDYAFKPKPFDKLEVHFRKTVDKPEFDVQLTMRGKTYVGESRVAALKLGVLTNLAYRVQTVDGSFVEDVFLVEGVPLKAVKRDKRLNATTDAAGEEQRCAAGSECRQARCRCECDIW